MSGYRALALRGSYHVFGADGAPRTLKKGDKGDDVKRLQSALINAGYPCGKKGADGIFGIDTEKAVWKFQTDRNLKSKTGEAGAETLAILLGTGTQLPTLPTGLPTDPSRAFADGAASAAKEAMDKAAAVDAAKDAADKAAKVADAAKVAAQASPSPESAEAAKKAEVAAAEAKVAADKVVAAPSAEAAQAAAGDVAQAAKAAAEAAGTAAAAAAAGGATATAAAVQIAVAQTQAAAEKTNEVAKPQNFFLRKHAGIPNFGWGLIGAGGLTVVGWVTVKIVQLLTRTAEK